MAPLSKLRWLELALDIVIIINIVSIFFTAQFNDEDIINNFKKIAKSYLKGYFVLDLLSCLPGFVTTETLWWVYYFKLLRYI